MSKNEVSIREAILKAADYIGAHPERFDMASIRVPRADCGAPGCALGWISHFYGVQPRFFGYYEGIKDIMGLEDDATFYSRMQRISGHKRSPKNWNSYGRWAQYANSCARVLRLYANKYHPLTNSRSDS